MWCGYDREVFKFHYLLSKSYSGAYRSLYERDNFALSRCNIHRKRHCQATVLPFKNVQHRKTISPGNSHLLRRENWKSRARTQEVNLHAFAGSGLRLRRNTNGRTENYASFDSLLSRAGLGHLGIGWTGLSVVLPLDDCLTGVTALLPKLEQVVPSYR